MTGTRSRSLRGLAAVVCLALLVTGCRDGGSDVDIEQATRELERAAAAVLTAIAPEAEITVEARTRPCIDAINRETGESIAELLGSAYAEGGGIGDRTVEELEERAREALRANGFEIDEEFPRPSIAGVRDDGIRVSIIAAPRIDGITASGSTGCRPPAG